jgi:O-antigen/teichoic acid export membrane protein
MLEARNIVWLSCHALARRVEQSVFAKQVGSTMLSQGVTLIISLATAAITARWLGPAGKGQLAMILMVPAMFQMFLSAGLGPANVYYVGSERIPIHQLSSNSVTFSMIGTVIGLIVLLLILMGDFLHIILPGISSGYLMLGMIALPLGLLSGNFNAILQGLQRILTLNILSVVGSLLSVSLLAVLLIGLKFGILGALVASLAVQAAMLISTGRCVQREGASFWPQWNPQVIKPTLSYGLKTYVGNLLQFFNYRLDMFIVNFFLGLSGVGIYGVSVVMAELLWQLPNAASFVIFPKSANSTQEAMNRFTPLVFWVLLAITTIGAIVLALFGKIAILIVFSSAFLGAYAPLLILLPGVVLLGAGKILTNDIAGRGYPHYNSITAGLSIVVTIILDLILIPPMGVVGAALASTASYSLTFFISVGFYLTVSRMQHVSVWI